MDLHALRTPAAYAAGLVLTLFLAAYLTPRRWWRRPTARALLIAGAGAWCFGTLLLQALGPASAQAASVPAATGPAPAASPCEIAAEQPAVRQYTAQADHVPPALCALPASFTVHKDLNLRAAAGIQAARLATIPAGTSITATGLRKGDWWQIRATLAGQEITGWSSSLWLRRSGE